MSLVDRLLRDAARDLAPRRGRRDYASARPGSRAKNRPGRVPYVNTRGEVEHWPEGHAR